MCYIWKNKQKGELSPGEIKTLFSDPFFSAVKVVGVSGGEPTLRKDLPEIFESLAHALPNLEALGIITNGLRPDDILEKLGVLRHFCRENGLKFSIMLSMDGVGDVHDEVRGRSGNFRSLKILLEQLKQWEDVELLFGATIIKNNVYNIDELLRYAEKKGFYGRFRIGEYINRLYNSDAREYIRAFTAGERYHLYLFFERLRARFENNPVYLNTYRNIQAMIYGGKNRRIACPYHEDAVVIDHVGGMLYCSPKSKILEAKEGDSPETVYTNNLSEKKRIRREDCDQCIHDYHVHPDLAFWISMVRDKFGKLVYWYCPTRFLNILSRIRFPKFIKQTSSILITGWYGTETAGDKAILAQIVKQLRQESADTLILASLYPEYTRHTLDELGMKDVTIVPMLSLAYLGASLRARRIIIGGGPLMGILPLKSLLWAFVAGRWTGAKTEIYGCGIGPDKAIGTQKTIQAILKYADSIHLRDDRSAIKAREEYDISKLTVIPDPAESFVEAWKKQQGVKAKDPEPVLNCYLRDLSDEYLQNFDGIERSAIRENYRRGLASLIREKASSENLKIRLLAMHHFHVGGDDRYFNADLAEEFLQDLEVEVVWVPFSLEDILQSMENASCCLCVRYHSVVFAHCLSRRYIAVDYTNGGKVSSFINEKNAAENLITYENLLGRSRGDTAEMQPEKTS